MLLLIAIGLATAAVGFLGLYGCRRDSARAVRSVRLAQGERLPNIVMITVDTLRANHMDLYGYERQTMPSVKAFSETAVVFDNAVVPRGSTRPSYASMLTGLYPYRHGVRTNMTELHRDVTTLQEVLKSAGYHTAGFVSNSVLTADWSGMSQGFDVYDDHLGEYASKRTGGRVDYERTAGNTLRAIFEWLATDPPQPFFLFMNFMDPHGPYTPPKKYRAMYKSGKSRSFPLSRMPQYQLIEGQDNYYDYLDSYDAEIRYTDEAIGELIDELKSKGLWEEAFVVFTADHGECLGQHGIYFEHYYHVYEETMRVPLVIRLPRLPSGQAAVEPKRVGDLVSPMDLTPTILEYLRLPCEAALDGQSLLPSLAGGGTGDRSLLLECLHLQVGLRRFGDIYALRTATHKLMRTTKEGGGERLGEAVYHIADDPDEARSVRFNAGKRLHRNLAERLDAALADVRSYKLPFRVVSYEPPAQAGKPLGRSEGTEGKLRKPLTTDQAERLRHLGYLP